MFKSEPICILQAGNTVDGRKVDQQMIDDMAEIYDPSVYNARINEEHWSGGYKFGSVLSVEKRDNQLWAVIKPNSMLLSTLERGQLLHTSCEIQPNFADTGKHYLTGLALTDEPASLGTTAMHLSAGKGRLLLSTGQEVTMAAMDGSGQENGSHSDVTLLSKIKSLVLGRKDAEADGQQYEHDDPKDEDDVSEELKTLLSKQNDTMATLAEAVTALSAQVEKLSVDGSETPPEEGNPKDGQDDAVAKLSAKVDELTVALSRLTDDPGRVLAGGHGDDEYL